MFNPLDMLQGQNGAGMQSMAQQFGLTPDQTRRAMEALMPAFALGMQRSAAPDPTGFSQLFGMAGRPAASPAETMLGQMFGSPALTQAILQQASSASGVGSQVLRQMLPAMAGAVVASVVHVLLNQQAPEKPAPAPAPSPFAVPPAWAEMMKAFLPADASPEKPKPQAARPQVAKPAPEPETPGAGMFQQMLKTGAEVQEQNVKAMKGLFDAFWTEADPAKAPAAVHPVPDSAPVPPAGPEASEGAQRPRKGRPAAR